MPGRQELHSHPRSDEDDHGSLQILMCRYEPSGKLQKSVVSVYGSEYLAISHAWGNAHWEKIPGYDEPLMVSKSKATFIAERLPQIVGDSYFWMDIMCVDQRNAEARIAVTQHIPSIFRNANRTIVLREGTAFEECCAIVIEDAAADAEEGFGWEQPLIDHHKAVHPRVHFDEVVFSRLWIMQEILLSDRVQFVRCDTEPLNLGEHGSDYIRKWAAINLRESLKTLASSWSLMWREGSATKEAKLRDVRAFLLAFLTCGTVSRDPVQNQSSIPTIGIDSSIWVNAYSLHRATKCRDYVLAVMPRFEFYKVPPGVRQMSFGELFVDCFFQLEKEAIVTDSYGLLDPLITAPFDAGFATLLPSANIPEPKSLGDFVKLLSGPRLSLRVDSTTGYVESIIYRAEIRGLNSHDLSDVLCAVIYCLSITTPLWFDAFIGELGEAMSNSDYERVPPTLNEELDGWEKDLEAAYDIARFIIKRLAISIPLPEIQNQLCEDERCRTLLATFSDTSSFENLIRIITLVTCNIGLSALKWAEQNLNVVLVDFRGLLALAFVPKQFTDTEMYEYFLVKADGFLDSTFESCQGFRLVALKRTDRLHGCVCLAPPALRIAEWGPGEVIHHNIV